MQRETSTEWLDAGRGTPREVATSLDDLWRINRWLGGVSGSLLLLERFVTVTGQRTLRALDLGAGDARLADCLARKMETRKISVQFTVLDRNLTHLTYATSLTRRQAVAADVLALPFPPQSFDVVMCNLFFHHFSDERAVRVLTAMKETARRAVLINDLERSALAHFFIRYAWPFARSPITKHDGPASVRQAYSRAELAALVEKAGHANYEIVALCPSRLGVILWK